MSQYDGSNAVGYPGNDPTQTIYPSLQHAFQATIGWLRVAVDHIPGWGGQVRLLRNALAASGTSSERKYAKRLAQLYSINRISLGETARKCRFWFMGVVYE